MKIKDLLLNRDKLQKYDELTATLESARTIKDWFDRHKDDKGWVAMAYIDRHLSPMGMYLTPSALDAIIAAIEAEIAKLDEDGD